MFGLRSRPYPDGPPVEAQAPDAAQTLCAVADPYVVTACVRARRPPSAKETELVVESAHEALLSAFFGFRL